MGNFCQQVLKPLGSYTRVFTVMEQIIQKKHSLLEANQLVILQAWQRI